MSGQIKKEFVKTRGGREANRLIAGQYQKGWDHYEAGGLTAWLMYGPRREILKCFDIWDIYPENYAANCSIKQETSPYIEYAENEGFSQDICGYLRLAMGYALALSRNENTRTAPFGGMPRPSMLLSGSRLCDPRVKAFETIRRYLNVPTYIYDHMVPPTEDPRCMSKEDSEHYIRHNLEGYRGLVKFLEKQTGKKLDIDQLREVVRDSLEALRLTYDCFEMRTI
jgi:benzoyl-CoA reductase/2-hydroxyglutaryl-CoA dehydratase subunit BcrC/BadD/HgdB